MEPTQETMQQVSEAIAPMLNDPRYAELITRDLASRGLLRQADAVEHSNWRGWARQSEVTVEPPRAHGHCEAHLGRWGRAVWLGSFLRACRAARPDAPGRRRRGPPNRPDHPVATTLADATPTQEGYSWVPEWE